VKNILILGSLTFLFLGVGCSSSDSLEVKFGSSVKKNILNATSSNNIDAVIFPKFGVEWQTICLLRPYQNSVPINYQVSSKINSYLKEVGFVADESHFVLVFVKGAKINIAKIKRGSALETEYYNSNNDNKT
jgi:hypothetical protein